MNTFKGNIFSLPKSIFRLDEIEIRPIQDDRDLWYAVVECQLLPEQVEYVNPAGFSIGRAYLHPESNIPCVILKDGIRIGYIVLRKWFDDNANSWSYYLDRNYQGYGYGKTAARLAIQIFENAEPCIPIKLSTERANHKAQKLYASLGFLHHGEMDGDDLVFEYRKVYANDLFG